MATLRVLVIVTKGLVILTIAMAAAGVGENLFSGPATAPSLSGSVKPIPSRESDRAVVRACCIIRSTP